MNQDQLIINLEMKISYLEDFVQQLQEVVLEQGAALERLNAENQHIKTKLADMAVLNNNAVAKLTALQDSIRRRGQQLERRLFINVTWTDVLSTDVSC